MQFKSLLAASLLSVALAPWVAGASPVAGPVAQPAWSPSWMASAEPLWGEDFVLPVGVPRAFDHQTVRQGARLSIGGSALRVTLSNEYASSALHVGAASVGSTTDTATASVASPRPLTFGGRTDIVIPAGATATSDPVDMQVAPLSKVAVSVFVVGPSMPGGFHWDAQEAVHVADGDRTLARELPSDAIEVPARAFLGAISVLTQHSPRTLVALGDSITDGAGSTPDADRRWPDALAAETAGQGIGVLNAGIGGGRLLRDGMGVSGLERLERDVFQQPGLSVVVVLLGTNDIGWPGGPFAPTEAPVTPDELIAGYRQLIAKARLHDVRIVGVTLPPFKHALEGTPLEGHYSEAKERTREAVDDWIRSSKEFDAVADADAALRDPADAARLAPALDSGDHLHPGDAGYRAIAQSVARALESIGIRR